MGYEVWMYLVAPAILSITIAAKHRHRNIDAVQVGQRGVRRIGQTT